MVTFTPMEVPERRRVKFAEMAGLGDLEFQADLQDTSDSLSRLGYSEGISTFLPDKNPQGLAQDNVAFHYRKRNKDTGEIVQDQVHVGARYANSNAVWNHEFRHRGFLLLKDKWAGREDEFTTKYGDEATLLLFYATPEEQNEVYDRLHKPASFKDENGKDTPFSITYDAQQLIVPDSAVMGLNKAAEELSVEQGAPPRARAKDSQ